MMSNPRRSRWNAGAAGTLLTIKSGAGVVVSIDQMNGHTGFRLAGLQHSLEHPIPIHSRPAEARQECRVRVEDSALERPEYEWPQSLHVTRQEHDIDVGRNQSASNRRVQRGRIRVRFRR